jgi:transposase
MVDDDVQSGGVRMTQQHLTVKNLDHLGIVAGIVDELGVVEVVNQYLGQDPREQISAGVAVKAMILNGLGFVSSPLYLFEQFFTGKATEHLLGPGVLPEHLNDDRLGRVLDGLYLVGSTMVFLAICLNAVERFGVERNRAHLDASSMSVSGAYLNAATGSPLAATVPIQICHGYSRDHRPDLKQFVINLVSWGDGDIPAFLELADGNQSDKASFADILQQFQKQWDFEGVYVADSALYSADNVQQLGSLRWISRVPLTLKQASDLLTQIDESALEPTAIAGYRIAEVCCSYGGIRQRWLVVESAERKAADLKQLDQRFAQATQQAQTQLDQLSRQPFACQADAQQALEQFQQTLKLHHITQATILKQAHYDQPGRPAKQATPSSITYHIQATLSLDPESVAQQQRRAGRFILATNVLASPEWELEAFTTEPFPLATDEILCEYKAQQGTERGFRFLKDPLFFTSSVFLKSPERIMALGMIMGLCLLVYNLAQRKLRNALKAANEAIPNQLGKLTDTPTLRWIFQVFRAIHWVCVEGQVQVVNLTDTHRKILKFLGSASQEYYLLS